MNVRRIAMTAVASALCATAFAQAPAPQYGPNITLDQARKAVAAGEAEARKNGWPMAIAVVDTAGQLVYFQKLDQTQVASVAVSQDKAVSAAIYRRPTKAFQDVVAGGGAGLRILQLRGAVAVEGGLPISIDGKVVGAIGVSGGSSEQDGQVAKAGVDGLATK
jgi:uncharacterized protein GlcG (DUF336 family)